jgi:hypothetical protein
MLRTLKALLKFTQVLSPQTITSNTSATGVDVAEYGSVTFAVNVGAFAFDNSNKLDIVLQHADVNTDGSFADCVDADIIGAETGASGIVKVLDSTDDQNTVHLAHYKGNKRYVRVRLEETGTVSCIVGVTAIQGHPEALPAS